ncbi:MAG: hypothetical protein ACKO3W_15615 [bacterium]
MSPRALVDLIIDFIIDLSVGVGLILTPIIGLILVLISLPISFRLNLPLNLLIMNTLTSMRHRIDVRSARNGCNDINHGINHDINHDINHGINHGIGPCRRCSLALKRWCLLPQCPLPTTSPRSPRDRRRSLCAGGKLMAKS